MILANDEGRQAQPPRRSVAAASGQGVPTPQEARIETVEEPGPLAAAERRAVTELTPRVVELAALAETVDARLRQYVRACRPARLSSLPPASNAGGDWPVGLLLDPAVAASRQEESSGGDPSGCVALWKDVTREASQLAAALDGMQAFARSKRVLPGHVRDALAEYRLDGWTRYPAR